MTFLEIQNKVLALMDESGDTGTVLENTKTFINSALKNRAMERKWPFMLSDETAITLTAATTTYDLPSDFATMHWIKDANNRLIVQLPLEQRFQGAVYDETVLTSYGYGDYVIYGDVIKFLTVDESHGGLDFTMQYYKVPEDLVDDEDEPDFPAKYHDLIVYDAVIALKGYHAELENIEYLLEQQRRAEQRLYVSNFGADSVGHSVKTVRYAGV